MKARIRALLDRLIREGIEHAFMNTDVEVSHIDEVRLISEIDSRIWLYIDDYFDFDLDLNL